MPKRRRLAITVAIASCTVLVGAAAAANLGPQHAGPKANGTAVIPIGYRVTPAGAQSHLGDLPLTVKAFPDGKATLVVNAGQGVQSLQVVDPASGNVSQSIEFKSPEALFVGAAFSPDGTKAYVSAGGNDKIRRFNVAGDRITETAAIPLPTKNPAGTNINLYPAELAVTPDGKRLVVADQLADAATVVDLATLATQTVAVEHAPYGVALSPDGGTAYVTNQGGASVSVLDLTGAQPTVKASIAVGTHPNRVVLDAAHHALYVANGDSDTISVIDTATSKVARTIDLAPYRNAQVGSNPDALALSGDGATLYVANSGNNDIAVVQTSTGRVTGLIPTGWYPSAIIATADRLLVANAKGLGAGPNDGPNHPNPYSTYTAPNQYSGSMMVGTLTRVGLPLKRDQLQRWTQQVNDNNGFGERATADTANGFSVVPRRPGESSPIKHVIYVVRENRTYDQELGSLGKGNGDATLNLFGDESAPNTRALARQFSTVDNFYANAEVSAQGWNWVVAGNSNPYSEQTWVANYSGRNHPYPSEVNDPAIAPQQPSDAYIWQRLAKAGVSYRNYGFYVGRDATGQFVAGDQGLNANTDHAYTGFNMACPDSATNVPLAPSCGPTSRIAEWKKEFNQYVAGNNLPSVEFLRLPNDHTAGTSVGAPTPRAYVADNDWALGQLVDAVSHSAYWKSTAIFVTEDDSQNGPDHVDAHRTVALAISPYTQTGRVDSTFYSTDSMLRTIELLAGVRPLTQFDAYATPMIGSFTNRPSLTPYAAIKPSQSLTEVNPVNAPMAAQSGMQDLSVEDQINEQVFNQAVWKSIKGVDSTMPAPRHTLWGSVPNNQAPAANAGAAAADTGTATGTGSQPKKTDPDG
jgi:YVTN family beta-propeller protein